MYQYRLNTAFYAVNPTMCGIMLVLMFGSAGILSFHVLTMTIITYKLNKCMI